MNHRNLRNASGGHACLIGETASAQHENVRGVVQVGAAAFRQRHHWQLVLHGNLLQPQGLVQPRRRNGAALDGAVAGHHQAANTANRANAGNNAATGQAAVLVVVHLVAGQGAQLQEWRTTIQQAIDAITG